MQKDEIKRNQLSSCCGLNASALFLVFFITQWIVYISLDLKKKKRGKQSIFLKFNITIQLTVFTVSAHVLKVKL